MRLDSIAPQVDAQHPWLGLLPYKEEHREFFFGRDREVEDILGRIRDNSLTILYGQSGLGKSSLLAAGVIPRLRDAGYAPSILRLGFGKSGVSILSQTFLALRIWLTGHWCHKALICEEKPETYTLWEHFHRKDVPTNSVTVLIFDQFEEIFTLGSHPQFEPKVSAWLEQVADLLQNRPPLHLADLFAKDPKFAEQYHFGDAPVRIVFTLREDYLANLERWKAQLPLLMQNRMALTLLTGPQAKQAVLGPAQLGDHSLVSREVAENIVRTVARVPSDTPLEQIKAVPPLLSLLCEQLNAVRLNGVAQITASMVNDRADDILQRFYVESFDAFPQERRSVIRSIIEDPPMITEGGFRNSLVRDDAEAQLTRAGVADAKNIFDILIQRRLITAETRDQVQRLEVTHDVLVPLLLRSRKERKDRDAREEAERMARIAKAEQSRLANERRRLKILIGVITIFAVTAIAFAFYGWWQASVARKAEEKAARAASKSKTDEIRAKEAEKTAKGATQVAQSSESRAREAETKALGQIAEASKKAWGRAADQFTARSVLGGFAYLAEAVRYDSYLPEPQRNQTIHDDVALKSLYLEFPKIPLLRRVCHKSDVNTAVFSPDGRLVLTASKDSTARLWVTSTGQASGNPLRHEREVNTAAFSPDGKYVVTSSKDNTARLWNAATGEPASPSLRHDGEVNSATFSSDGKYVVTASEDKTARLWDTVTGLQVGKVMSHKDSVNYAEFDPDGKRIVTGSSDKTIQVWNASTTARIGSGLKHGDIVLRAAFSPDGKSILSIGIEESWMIGKISRRSLRLWDSVLHIPLGNKTTWSTKNVGTFSGDGQKLLTISNGIRSRPEVWTPHSGEVSKKSFDSDDESFLVTTAEFSPDGQRVVTSNDDNTARLWDVATGDLIGEAMPHDGSVTTAKFSADGERILTVSSGGVVCIWDAATALRLGEVIHHEDDVNSSRLSPDRSRIVTASDDRTARIWDFETCRPLGEAMRHDESVVSAEFSPDGSQVVTASADNTARLWDAVTGKPLSEPMTHDDGVNSANFSPDGRIIVTASDDDTAVLWDAATGRRKSEPIKHDSSVESAKFSPDGNSVLTIDEDHAVRIWATAAGNPLKSNIPHQNRLNTTEFSPDGTRIVTIAEMEWVARIWDADTGRVLTALSRNDQEAAFAKFSRDGKLIHTLERNSDFRTWDASTGNEQNSSKWTITRGIRFLDVFGSYIILNEDEETAQRWDAPITVEWIDARDLISLSGRFVNEEGLIGSLTQEERIQWLLQFLEAPASTPWKAFTRWKVSDPRTRTATFCGKTRTPDYIEREITWAMSHLHWFKRTALGAPELHRTDLTNLLTLDPGAPLVHFGLAAIEENAVSRKFLINYGLGRLLVAGKQAAHQKYPGTYRAKAAIILLLMNEKAHARKLFTKLIEDLDPKRETWANPAWVNQLSDFEWPKIFRQTLLELGK